MSESPPVPPIVNYAMKLILRSPLHGMVSKNLLLITFTGRKSGNTYTTPVSYSQSNNCVTIFTHATWWKNLRNDQPITLHLRGQNVQGMPETVVENKQAIATALSAHLRGSPSDARFYNVTFDDQGNPRPEDVGEAIQTVVMIRVQLC